MVWYWQRGCEYVWLRREEKGQEMFILVPGASENSQLNSRKFYLFLVADYIHHYVYHEKMCYLAWLKTFLFFIELNKARVRVEKWNVDNSKSDRITRELRAQVDDLTEAVAAKDSQLAVLKVRLQEADQVLSSRTEALEALQSEKSR